MSNLGAIVHAGGRQSGDFFSADVNWGMCINTNYIAGSKLHIVREELKTYILYYQGKKEPAPLANFQIFYIHLTVLVEGVHVASQSCVDGFPGEQELLSMPEHRHMKMLHLVAQIYGLVWAVLFQEPNRMSRCASVTDVIAKHKHSLRILCLIGIFYEGLASFQLARQTSETMKKMEWFKRGEAALALLTTWSEHSTWNWENKKLLLEAESMQVSGNLDRAGTLYIDAIRSAREHKFIQEEAISRLVCVSLHALHCICASYFLPSVVSWPECSTTEEGSDKSRYCCYPIQSRATANGVPRQLLSALKV